MLDLHQLHKRHRIDWMALPLRLVIGFGFMVHGWAKLSRGPDGFAHVVAWIGFPLPHFFAWLTTLTELVTGFVVLIGAFVTIAAVPMVVILLVAMFTVHWPYGFSSIKTVAFDPVTGPEFGPPGVETDLLYIGGLLLLAVGTGAGALSVDRLRASRKRREQKPRATDRHPSHALNDRNASVTRS